MPLYSVRVSGTATNTDCNNITIEFTYEVFKGFVLPQDMTDEVPVGVVPNDDARERRAPLTVVTPTP